MTGEAPDHPREGRPPVLVTTLPSIGYQILIRRGKPLNDVSPQTGAVLRQNGGNHGLTASVFTSAEDANGLCGLRFAPCPQVNAKPACHNVSEGEN